MKNLDAIILDPKFIGFNIQKMNEELLGKLRDNKDILEILSDMIKEIELKEVEDVTKQAVNPSTLDISEKLSLTKRQERARFRFTLKNLAEVAHLELKRRES